MKIENDKYHDFKHGSIVRIELENFMTYKHIEFLPGPFLNLILGPNGSGKSALVCSIILGFGGDAQITGRSSNLIEYIKFGTNFASIKIELFNSNKNETNFILQREFRLSINNKGRAECHTIWRLNNKQVKKESIIEFMKNLNIDVNNLCQILPQERVVEFSKLNSKDLLFSTEKSTGNIDMYEKHQKLITLSKEIEIIELKIREAKSYLMKYQNFKTNIEPDLRLIQEKKRYEEEIEWFRKKYVWLEFEEKRLKYLESQKQYNDCKTKFNEFIDQIEPKRLFKEKSIKLYNEIQLNKINLNKQLQQYQTNMSNQFDQLNNLKEKITKTIVLYNEKLSERRTIKERLQSYQQDYCNYKNDLNENHPKPDELDSDMNELRKKLSEIDVKIRETISETNKQQNEYENLTSEQRYLQNRKNEINNLFNIRLDRINQKDQRSRQAYEWYMKNKEMFTGQVYPPLITQINVHRIEYADAVEMSIGTMDMSTFLFEKLTDLELFNDQLKTELNIRVNVAMLPPDDDQDDDDDNGIDIESYKKYGIFARVCDLFTAPKKILKYLQKNYSIHLIPIGNDLTEQQENNIDELINHSDFRKIITGKNFYSIVKSIYDGEKSTQIIPIRKAKYLNIIINEKEIENINQKLQQFNEKLSEIKQIINEYTKLNENLKSERQELLNQLKTIELKKNELNKLIVKIKNREEQIQKLKSELLKDENLFKKEFIENLNHLHQKQLLIIEQLPMKLKESMQMNKQYNIIMKKFQSISSIKSMAQIEYDSLNEIRNNQLQILQQLDIRMKEDRTIAKDYRNRAKEKSGFDYTENLQDDIREQMNKLPDTMDEIIDSIDILKLRCEGIKNVDHSLLEQYKLYQSEIQNKTDECNHYELKLSEYKQKIDQLKPEWIQELNNLIDKINDNYTKFMSHLNYSGEVYLFTGNKEYSFDDYGIRIKVKFRDNEPMIDLDVYHQSGGERSVSTMIYMLSLQELSNVPFRIVDEINQGMDEINERCVFDLIADVSKSNQSQYFLLSPKLLTGLKYTDEMKIHIVFNSPYSYIDWNKCIDRILKDADDDDDDDEDGIQDDDVPEE